MPAYSKSDLERRMHGAVESLKHDLQGLRTGRASTTLLDPVTVDVYGAQMPLNQVASVSAPEPRMLSVQVWDKSNVGPVDKAIRSAGLGLNPIVDGQTLRIPVPPLTEERRKDLVKSIKQMAEEVRVRIRSARREAMDVLKKGEKDGDVSEDDLERYEGEVQKLTDQFVKRIEAGLEAKETDIMRV